MTMKHQVELNSKQVSVTLSQSAIKRLNITSKPLLIDIELYFSCLIKKVCHIRETEDTDNYVRVMDGLYMSFRATMTSKCSIDDFDKDKTADFPIVDEKPYIPKWVKLDFSNNNWCGDFGYAE
jgi:hypothetical protein